MADTKDTGDRARVRLMNPEYMVEHGGRLPAGTAVEVDRPTADRWLAKGIAEGARKGDKTLREQKLALIAQLRGEVQELEPAEDDAPADDKPEDDDKKPAGGSTGDKAGKK